MISRKKIAAEQRRLFARLKKERADALSALGCHPDSEAINLADEIARLRDEGRQHFHDLTALSQKYVALTSAVQTTLALLDLDKNAARHILRSALSTYLIVRKEGES